MYNASFLNTFLPITLFNSLILLLIILMYLEPPFFVLRLFNAVIDSFLLPRLIALIIKNDPFHISRGKHPLYIKSGKNGHFRLKIFKKVSKLQSHLNFYIFFDYLCFFISLLIGL